MFLAIIDDESDKQLFVQIYNKYRHQVFIYALDILRDEGLAEDASQETFLRIAKNIGKYNFNRNLILTIARNTALNILKKNQKEIVCEDIEVLSEKYSDDGSYEYDLKADTARVFEIVNAMPEKYATVFYLKYARGLHYSEIGRLLNIDVGTAKKRIQRIKEHIRQIMEQEA